MRIAYLINQYPKVSHSFIRREIMALERRGVDVMRISLRGWDIELVDAADLAERQRTRYVLHGGAWALLPACFQILISKPRHLLKALKLAFWMGWRAERPLPVHFVYLIEACQIALWLRDGNIQHLHAHFGTNSAEVAMLVHVLGGPPWSLTVHGPIEFEQVQSLGLVEKLRRASFVVAISSYGRSQMYRLVAREHWGKIHVVHCGLDEFFTVGDVTDVPSTRRLVCVGRLCEQKGQLLLIEAVHRLVQGGEQLELVLAGDGEMRTVIEDLIAHYKLEASICITGWIDAAQVQRALQHARALVLPSFAEGLPVVIMEAMALGRPVISTYVAGIPELVRPAVDGWLVPPGDVAALVEAMRACLNAPVVLLTRMGEAAKKRVSVRHNVDKEAGRLVELFQSAIGRR